MDWSKIKTIFIISFLLLDIYLMYQFLIIRNANKYEFVAEATLEDKLKTEEINFVEIPKLTAKDHYLSAKVREFNEKDYQTLKGQIITITEGTTLHSFLEKPISLNKKFDPLEAQSFLHSFVLNGDQYGFWEFDEVNNIVTFYQKYDNKMFYENINGKVTLYLNKDFQIISYDQTYMEAIESLTEKEDVLPARKALETLYQKGLLEPKSEITNIEIGYSTLVQLAASQVLTPTWHFVIDDQDHLYVNAFEGQIIQFGSEENNKLE
jgi:regulatory protein YycI of two-component signal transduction system YycFG